MKELALAVLPELDRTEMLELVAGGDPGTGFFHDLGYVVGYAVGAIGNAFDATVAFVASQPAPSYTYCKVGT